MNSKITVSGKIISELSEKIPTNIIALNELLKNAYDAGASSVRVILNTNKKKLTVIDDGSGMSKNDIDTLFHISNSTKKYGKINEYGRRTQGSKGLGFLSVFKFGRIVEWKTKKDDGLSFKVNYEELIASDDISQFDIDIISDNSIAKGTSIIITLDDYNITSLKQYLSVPKNYKKILAMFDDKNFRIDLKIDDLKYSSDDNIPLKDNAPEAQLYSVKYDDVEQKIKFKYNNVEILDEDYKFSSKAYKLEIDLIIYQFKAYGKKNVDELFLNQQNDLCPLIYVNSNLFNNYDLFNPNIMKNIKTSYVLNQMVGFIKITSTNPMINFNSDRSQFLQNEITDEIREFLTNINKQIQILGSNNKKYLANRDFLTVQELPAECISIRECEKFRKYIKEDFSFKKDVKISREKNVVKYAIFGKEVVLPIKQGIPPSKHSGNGIKDDDNEEKRECDDPVNVSDGNSGASSSTIVPARISLIRGYEELYVPSSQLDLRTYIDCATDSAGEKIEHQNICIKDGNNLVANGILESITDKCIKKIEYSYKDPCTGIVITTLDIKFSEHASGVKCGKSETPIVCIPGTKENYNINYNIYINSLIEQINDSDKDNFLALISCGLRAGFELSVDSIKNSVKFPDFFKSPTQTKLDDRVIHVINFIKSDKKFLSAIALSAGVEYKTISNLLDEIRFKSAISSANLGAHKAGEYLGKADVEAMGRCLGVFVLVVNEMLSNGEIK